MKALFSAVAAAAVLLASCRGTAPMLPPERDAATLTVPPAASRVTLIGTVVDNPNGKPLRDVQVRLDPWTACKVLSRKDVRCPTALQSTRTDHNGRFELRGVADAHYLLVIGSDSVTDFNRPTIHDSIDVRGSGVQRLIGPTPPPLPITRADKVERSGVYRLATLTANESTCMQAFDAVRRRHGLNDVVADEWLVENIRLSLDFQTNPSRGSATPNPANPYGSLTTGNSGALYGGVFRGLCANIATTAFQDVSFTKLLRKYVESPQDLWFAGASIVFTNTIGKNRKSTVGFIEAPIDPRAFADPNAVSWP